MMNLRLKLAALAALATSAVAYADVKINDTLSTSGYVVGSYQYNQPKPGSSSDHFDLDALKAQFNANLKPVSAVISLYHVPNAPDNVTILDAYATYDLGDGLSVTGGKFLSYLGYEAFDPVNMTQITYANGAFLGPIPGYHEGVRLDYGDATQSAGVAILDSVYSGPYYLKGDGELKHNAGFEAFYSYKGVKDLTLWAGLAYDTKGNVVHKDHEIVTLDFWASYAVSKEATIAAEYANKDGGAGDKGYNWLTLLSYTFTDKVSSIFRISGEKLSNGGPGFTKYTVAPTYTLTSNLSVRAEYSYVDYKDFAGANSANFIGVQAVLKW
jgi:hypothetical protein